MNSQVVVTAEPAIPSARVQTLVAHQSAVPSGGSRSLPLLLAVATGGALWLCYFPANLGWLAWVALVPLLVLVRGRSRPWVLYLSAYAGGLAFFVPALQWMRVADPRMAIAWAVLAVYCSLYFPAALWVVRFLDRRTRLPLLLSAPLAWTALEYFRSYFGNDFFGSGFSWYQVGHTQHDFLPLIQVSDLAGAYAVSFLVVMVNALLLEALDGRSWFRRLYGAGDVPARWGRPAILLQGVAVLVLLLGTLGYGLWRMGQATYAPGPRVALLQGNLGQQIRNDLNAADSFQDHFDSLCSLAASYRPALIVWPETSYPYEWQEVAPDVTPEDVSAAWRKKDEFGRAFARDVANNWHTPLLMGLNSNVLERDGRARRYNSALLIEPPGKVTARYDKIHCVPFGEYVPFKDSLPFMKRLAPYDYEYSVSQGREYTRFQFPAKEGNRPYSFGVIICFEDTDPAVSRPYGGGYGRPPADFLFNISNDGWFDGTSEHDEHLAICRFRAVECRRTVARAVNMGISAVIDGNGRVLQPETRPLPRLERGTVEDALRKAGHRDSLPRVWEVPAEGAEELPTSRWGEFKKVPGILLANLPIDGRRSLYAVWGDWLPWACWLVIGAGVVLGWIRPARTSGV
jgi:apolipoprotein N-acyltransferase